MFNQPPSYSNAMYARNVGLAVFQACRCTGRLMKTEICETEKSNKVEDKENETTLAKRL